MQGRMIPYLAKEIEMYIRHRRPNLSLLFLASALLLLTACGTMEVGAEHLPVQEDEPPTPPGS